MKPVNNIMIVDDHQLFLDGLGRILEEETDFSIIGLYNDLEDLFRALETTKPDLLILDIRLSKLNGIEGCYRVKQTYPDIKILFISMFETVITISECKKAGAEGFLPKTTEAFLVKDTIRKILHGEKIFITPENCENSINDSVISLISKREKEIIRLLCEGLTVKKIAGVLYISEYTVETHKKNIFRKLEVNSTPELLSFVYENGI